MEIGHDWWMVLGAPERQREAVNAALLLQLSLCHRLCVRCAICQAKKAGPSSHLFFRPRGGATASGSGGTSIVFFFFSVGDRGSD